MENILVSACLLGIGCRYDGKHKANPEVLKLKERYNLIPVCPEIFGGLPTPRVPSERIGDKVMMKDGRDVTENYQKGAEEALELCRIYNIKTAILKERSPSCGKGFVYDGTFTGVLTERDGVTAELLLSAGIRVIGESEINILL
ncbi:MAG: DUF523 domain-containing protein [Clostridia bacterium]|nr:DUF523 domain-containing protein [Clostridia bacterium]